MKPNMNTNRSLTAAAPSPAFQPPEKRSALTIMGTRYNVDPTKLLDTLKATSFKGATNEEMMTLVIVANEYRLNPFTKEIYAFPAKGGGIVPVVGIDGWIRIMNDHPQFDGIEFEDEIDETTGKPVYVTAIIYRKDRTRSIRITELYSECHRNTDPWNKQPYRMLRHRAICQGCRVAFGFSGIFDEDEVAVDYSRPSGPIPRVVVNETAAAPALPEPAPEPSPADNGEGIDLGPIKKALAVEPADQPASPEPSAPVTAPVLTQARPRGAAATAQGVLMGIITDAGYTFDQFRTWSGEIGMLQDASKYSEFGELSDNDAKRMIRSKVGILDGMKVMFGGAK